MFFFNNVKRCHWNFVVIYPKLQVIELIDSFTVNDDSINKLKIVWEFLWRYCEDKNIEFDAKKWKIFHSRQCLLQASDHFNSGYYAILYVAAIFIVLIPVSLHKHQLIISEAIFVFIFMVPLQVKRRILAFVMLGTIIM